MVILIGGLLTFARSVYLEHKKMEMERVQFESSLILNSIDKSDIETSKKILGF